MVRLAGLFLITLFLSVNAFAQRMDNPLSYRQTSFDRCLRISYDNDFFTATDKYYTQGINIELAARWVSRLPSSRLLLHPFHDYAQYGVGVQHNGYTPSDIAKSAILYGDRPFAACLFATNFVVTADTIRHQRFFSSVNAGVIGPAAGGMEMQTAIHRWLHDITPHGWQNQVHNDIILNYELRYERRVVSSRQFFSLDADVKLKAGTLSDKTSVGGTMKLGYLDSPYRLAAARRQWIYLYLRPVISIIGYDATLEGGLLNKTSPCIIKAAGVARATFENSIGIVINCNRINVTYGYTYLSSEFLTGQSHSWGGVMLSYGF